MQYCRTRTTLGTTTLANVTPSKVLLRYGHDSCISIRSNKSRIQMPIISLPPFATLRSNSVSITVNGASVSTSEYTASWSSGYNSGSKSKRLFSERYLCQFDVLKFSLIERNVQQDFSFAYTFYVDSNNQMRRVVFDVNLSGTTLKTTLDFWNIAAVSSDDQILPDAKCNGVCKEASVETVETYPTTCTAADQCQCVTNITFCKDIVTYPTSTLIHLAEADSFTQTAYNTMLDTVGLVGDVPDSCKSDLKVFLCKFYIPLCTSEVNIAKPEIDVFECKDASTSVKDAARDNRAFSAYNAASGQTASSSAVSIVPAFLLVVASLLVINLF